jgi:prevent-host-death family protein
VPRVFSSTHRSRRSSDGSRRSTASEIIVARSAESSTPDWPPGANGRCTLFVAALGGVAGHYQVTIAPAALDIMTISGHDVTMTRAKVSELKARLSMYLARVRRGDTVIVCDRDTPVARLVPYTEQNDGFVVHEPARPLGGLVGIRGVKPRRPVDVVDQLRLDRDHR